MGAGGSGGLGASEEGGGLGGLRNGLRRPLEGVLMGDGRARNRTHAIHVPVPGPKPVVVGQHHSCKMSDAVARLAAQDLVCFLVFKQLPSLAAHLWDHVDQIWVRHPQNLPSATGTWTDVPKILPNHSKSTPRTNLGANDEPPPPNSTRKCKKCAKRFGVLLENFAVASAALPGSSCRPDYRD